MLLGRVFLAILVIMIQGSNVCDAQPTLDLKLVGVISSRHGGSLAVIKSRGQTLFLRVGDVLPNDCICRVSSIQGEHVIISYDSGSRVITYEGSEIDSRYDSMASQGEPEFVESPDLSLADLRGWTLKVDQGVEWAPNDMDIPDEINPMIRGE